MSFSIPNISPATLTTNRVGISPSSGLCVSCLDGCPGYCEVGSSALKGRDLLYPRPFGTTISGSQKDYPVDFSHFNIQGSCTRSDGSEEGSKPAKVMDIDISAHIGVEEKIRLDTPCLIGALGSTDIAGVNWESIAIGAAICGTIVTVGENVCGMDAQSDLQGGRIVRSPEMERRITCFKDWHDGSGQIFVQCNQDDMKRGVPEYVIERLGVEGIEIKWGQDAGSICWQNKTPSIEDARELKNRGYSVIPDPDDPLTDKMIECGAVKELEVHGESSLIDEEGLLREVERLRNIGAKYISLKTGSYRSRDLALAIKCASKARVDLLTVDGSGSGSGMTPWRMMNEYGIPTVYIESLLYRYLRRIEKMGWFIPDCAIAGGIILEDQIVKALALGAPYITSVCMGRGAMAAAMVGRTHGHLIKERFSKDPQKYQDTILRTFSCAHKMKEKYGNDFGRIPAGAMGLCNYFDRLGTGLQQFLAGLRKSNVKHIKREDLTALTRECAEVSGIPYIMDADSEEAKKILS
ncbi:MAG: glutamate synthase-related protein [Thermodesulfobacteriota bacterium]|nr:glutamate synthase-related protein [Thermodesulfobacteriota bacterium]